MSGEGKGRCHQDSREALFFFFFFSLSLLKQEEHIIRCTCVSKVRIRPCFTASSLFTASRQQSSVCADGFCNDKIALICPITTLRPLLPMTHTVTVSLDCLLFPYPNSEHKFKKDIQSHSMTPNLINSIGTELVFFKATFKKLPRSCLQANEHAPFLQVY